MLRKYVAGFANGDGGFIVLGYHERSGTVDGFVPPGSGSAHDWATRNLADLIPFLSPQPRIRSVPYSGPLLPGASTAEVLLVAVSRAPTLVPCSESGRFRYYLRLGDSTHAVPEYLAADLLLGKRARAVLSLTLDKVEASQRQGSLQLGPIPVDSIHVHVKVANEGLLVADEVTVGAVAWTVGDFPQRRDPTFFLRTQLEVSSQPPLFIPQAPGLTIPWRLSHQSASGYVRGRTQGEDMGLRPFEWSAPLSIGPLTLPMPPRLEDSSPLHAPEVLAGKIEAVIAVYVLARNTEPAWYQATLTHDPTKPGFVVDFAACGTTTPIVSWRFVP